MEPPYPIGPRSIHTIYNEPPYNYEELIKKSIPPILQGPWSEYLNAYPPVQISGALEARLKYWDARLKYQKK